MVARKEHRDPSFGKGNAKNRSLSLFVGGLVGLAWSNLWINEVTDFCEPGRLRWLQQTGRIEQATDVFPPQIHRKIHTAIHLSHMIAYDRTNFHECSMNESHKNIYKNPTIQFKGARIRGLSQCVGHSCVASPSWTSWWTWPVKRRQQTLAKLYASHLYPSNADSAASAVMYIENPQKFQKIRWHCPRARDSMDVLTWKAKALTCFDRFFEGFKHMCWLNFFRVALCQKIWAQSHVSMSPKPQSPQV